MARCSKIGEICALLRCEGIYSSMLTNWRKRRDTDDEAALAPQRRARKADRVIAEARRVAELTRYANTKVLAALRHAESGRRPQHSHRQRCSCKRVNLTPGAGGAHHTRAWTLSSVASEITHKERPDSCMNQATTTLTCAGTRVSRFDYKTEPFSKIARLLAQDNPLTP